MKKLITLLALFGLAVLLRSLPRLAGSAFLHGTGTVVRDQRAWVVDE